MQSPVKGWNTISKLTYIQEALDIDGLYKMSSWSENLETLQTPTRKANESIYCSLSENYIHYTIFLFFYILCFIFIFLFIYLYSLLIWSIIFRDSTHSTFSTTITSNIFESTYSKLFLRCRTHQLTSFWS